MEAIKDRGDAMSLEELLDEMSKLLTFTNRENRNECNIGRGTLEHWCFSLSQHLKDIDRNKPVEYRTPWVDDINQECEFSNDNVNWVKATLTGYLDLGKEEQTPWISDKGKWKYARIEVTQ
jgi:hypothetical protein